MTPTPFPLPQGYRAQGIPCGIKADPSKRDLALFVSDVPTVAAGVFTQNRVVGAPVTLSRERLPAEDIRGVVINSGNANACTGQRGLEDATWMTATVAAQLGCEEQQILVCSTGIIGHFLPREKLAAGIPAVVRQLAATPEAFAAAAEAMRTTDTVTKLVARSAVIDGKAVTVSGAAKGAAMIAPNMATMLAVLMTDARLGAEDARRLLKMSVDQSFNRISVDGHMSTSDTVLLLANGASGVTVSTDADRETFAEVADDVCQTLAQMIIRDAEGADHIVTIDVEGLPTEQQAQQIARAVADSPLVKTAITGNDPNWGRIVSAAGYAGVPFEEADCSLWINGTLVYERGRPLGFDEAAVSSAMQTGEVLLHLVFTLGDAGVRFWTSDLTTEYVRLNSDYTT